MIEVYRIPIPKDRLMALPQDERVLLLHLGYVSNQLSMLRKLVIYSTKLDPEHAVERDATSVQTQMLIRIAVSATFEAWKVIDTRFSRTNLAKDYTDRLDVDGLDALNKLKLLFGKSALLPQIRNNFGYHHPTSVDVEAAFQAAAADPAFDDIWKVYFSHEGYNSLFLFSEAVFAHGIAKKANTADLAALQGKLMNELLTVSTSVAEFAQAFFAAAWLKHFGDVIDAQDVVKIEGAPSIDEITLPFFVEVLRNDRSVDGHF